MKIYKMTSDPGKRRRFAYAIETIDDGFIDLNCNICKKEGKGLPFKKKNRNVPLIISNKPLPDFMFYYITLISERVKNIFEEEGITGYELEKAIIKSTDNLTEDEELYFKENRYKQKDFLVNPPDYYKMFIPKFGAEPHESLGVKLISKCNACGYENYELDTPYAGILSPMILKKESIIISNDLFTVKAYGGEYCTERFKNIYDKHKLTGLNFEEVELL